MKTISINLDIKTLQPHRSNLQLCNNRKIDLLLPNQRGLMYFCLSKLQNDPMTNNYIVSIGSNTNPEQNVTEVQLLLKEAFTNVFFSDFQWVPAIGGNYTQPFYNGAVRFEYKFNTTELKTILKTIEAQLGRTPDQKALGIVPIDLDIIVCNGEIIHIDYERFPFVKKAVDSLIENYPQ